MNINQVKYFVSVFEQQSFSLAARERQVSVQAVSKSINDLEREIGQKLFERSGHGAAPTQLGRRFYQKARLALKTFAELESFASGVNAVPPTPVFRAALCAPHFTNAEVLQDALTKFVQRNTGFDVQLSLANPADAVQDIKDGKYDALITIGALESDEADCVCVGTLPTGVQISSHHPLTSEQFVTLEQLSQYPAGFSPLFDEFNDSILNMYQKTGKLGEVRRVESIAEDDYSFMQKDMGFFFTAMFPSASSIDGEIVIRPIAKEDNISVPICLVSNKTKKAPNHQAIETFLVNTVHLLQK